MQQTRVAYTFYRMLYTYVRALHRLCMRLNEQQQQKKKMEDGRKEHKLVIGSRQKGETEPTAVGYNAADGPRGGRKRAGKKSETATGMRKQQRSIS